VHRGEHVCVPLCVREIGWRDSGAADARQPYDSGFKLNTTAPSRLALAAFQYTISSLTVIIVARMQRWEYRCDASFYPGGFTRSRWSSSCFLLHQHHSTSTPASPADPRIPTASTPLSSVMLFIDYPGLHGLSSARPTRHCCLENLHNHARRPAICNLP
jgi:hypothetical protein